MADQIGKYFLYITGDSVEGQNIEEKRSPLIDALLKEDIKGLKRIVNS